MKWTVLSLALFATLALSQPAQEYVPPDQELWTQMSQAFATLSMPAAAHQQVQQIMRDIEREAAARAARKKAEQEKSNAK